MSLFLLNINEYYLEITTTLPGNVMMKAIICVTIYTTAELYTCAYTVKDVTTS